MTDKEILEQRAKWVTDMYQIARQFGIDSGMDTRDLICTLAVTFVSFAEFGGYSEEEQAFIVETSRHIIKEGMKL